jgi:hypothetical protein
MKNLNEFVNAPKEEQEKVLREVVKKANQDQLDEFNAINDDYVVDQFYDLADDNIEMSPAEQWSLLTIGIAMTVIIAVVIRLALWIVDFLI